jgi:pimeloyl-ACP methyl ester carboxylesterase
MRSVELKQVRLREHSVAYRAAGDGPPVVLLHGFLCDSRSWEPQLTGLSDAFRVFALGRSRCRHVPDPSEPFTTADCAHCLAEFLDAVSIQRTHVVALSWGGILAQEFYRLYRPRVLGLMLADTYAGWKGSLDEPVWQERLVTFAHTKGPCRAPASV